MHLAELVSTNRASGDSLSSGHELRLETGRVDVSRLEHERRATVREGDCEPRRRSRRRRREGSDGEQEASDEHR